MTDMPALQVLVADDETGMRLGIGRTLAGMTVADEHGEGHYSLEIIYASDGCEAGRILAEQSIDLALLDHGMPGLTGMEILAELQAGDSSPWSS